MADFWKISNDNLDILCKSVFETAISDVVYLTLYLTTLVQLVRPDCPAPSPCTCTDTTTIQCNDTQLKAVPHMRDISNTTYHLYLGENPDIVITNDSFKHIKLEFLKLHGVIHTAISRHALESQRHTLKEFYFFDCSNCDRLPPALFDLDGLETLLLSNSTFQHFDEQLMRKLGLTLNTLELDYNGLTVWPNWLFHMPNLEYLNIYGNNIQEIPNDAFIAFTSTLTFLNIRDTGISNMPTALTTLHHLKHLIIGGHTVTDSSFYDTWLPSNNLNLRRLQVIGTNITTIPFGLKDCRSIKTLDIHKSRIKHVDEEVLPKHLTRLMVTHSFLSGIDGGVCSPKLKELMISYNRITNIEKHDLRDCLHLTVLDVSNNKIDYISAAAFSHLFYIHEINLQSNRLVHIPEAIGSIDNVLYLLLDHNPLQCSCQDAWFHQWNRHLNTVHGQCSVLGIDITDFNPHCPGIFVG